MSPDVSSSDVEGTWRSNLGGMMKFEKGGKFTAENISLGYTCYPEGTEQPWGDRASGLGEWEVGAPRDEGPGVRIEFKPDGGPVESCEIYSLLTGVEPLSEMYLWHDDGEGERYVRDGQSSS